MMILGAGRRDIRDPLDHQDGARAALEELNRTLREAARERSSSCFENHEIWSEIAQVKCLRCRTAQKR
jgi:hypothetical protein